MAFFYPYKEKVPVNKAISVPGINQYPWIENRRHQKCLNGPQKSGKEKGTKRTRAS